jgi:hypothetical protein
MRCARGVGFNRSGRGGRLLRGRFLPTGREENSGQNGEQNGESISLHHACVHCKKQAPYVSLPI